MLYRRVFYYLFDVCDVVLCYIVECFITCFMSVMLCRVVLYHRVSYYLFDICFVVLCYIAESFITCLISVLLCCIISQSVLLLV